MKTAVIILLLFLSFCTYSFTPVLKKARQSEQRVSPDENIILNVHLVGGVDYYSVLNGITKPLNISKLKFDVSKLPSLDKNFKITAFKKISFAEAWVEEKNNGNNYNQLLVFLQMHLAKKKMNRVFD